MNFPGFAEIIDAIPIIFSLFIIEGLLSVDNILAIAAKASALPKEQQTKALRYGMVGAFAFRGICLFIAAWIASNQWIKLLGAIYLVYLMASNLGNTDVDTDAEQSEADAKAAIRRNFILTIISIELLDLSLSIDNIVAAVALDKRLWVVITGVFLGIIVLRVLAGYAIRLIEKFPILGKAAFLLIGYVGILLLVEIGFELAGHPIHIASIYKFIGITIIIGVSLLYDETYFGIKYLTPVGKLVHTCLIGLNNIFNIFIWPFSATFNILRGV